MNDSSRQTSRQDATEPERESARETRRMRQAEVPPLQPRPIVRNRYMLSLGERLAGCGVSRICEL